KKRKVWYHALENRLFNAHEIGYLGAPHRRTLYTASLEGHIDRLHNQLLRRSLFPAPPDALVCYRGLDPKLAKVMMAGLQYDITNMRLEIRERERSV
ncbi:hypothetical protein C8Q76DRAFT_580808, partial [Earliella scabrosa]